MVTSLRAVGAHDLDVAVIARARDAHSPWVAADFAVLDESAFDVGLEIDLDLLAAVRARHEKLIVHITKTATFNAKPARPAKDICGFLCYLCELCVQSVGTLVF